MTYAISTSQRYPWRQSDSVVKAFVEADAYDGPSIIIAYSHCIAHALTCSTV